MSAQPPPAAPVVANSTAAASSPPNEIDRVSKPTMRVSESGHFVDQFYYTRRGSQAMARLKKRELANDNTTLGATAARSDAEEMFTNSDIIASGYLIKEGSYWRTWKRRFFILRQDRPVLCYYTSADDLTKLGSVDLDDQSTIQLIGSSTSRPWQLQLNTSKRTLNLDAGNAACASNWMKAIAGCIKKLKQTPAEACRPFRTSIGNPKLALQKGHIAESFLANSKNTEQNSDSAPSAKPPTTQAIPISKKLVKRHSDPEMYDHVIDGGCDSFTTQRPVSRHNSVQIGKSLQHFSLLEMRPQNCIQLSFSFGISGAQPSCGLFVVVFEAQRDLVGADGIPHSESRKSMQKGVVLGELVELGRTEVKLPGGARACGSSYSLRDFSTLVQLPNGGSRLLQLEVYEFRSGSHTEQLKEHKPMAFVRISVEEIMLAPNGAMLLSLRPHQVRKNSPPHSLVSETKMVLVVESVPFKEPILLNTNYEFASQSYLACTTADHLASADSTTTPTSRRSTVTDVKEADFVTRDSLFTEVILKDDRPKVTVLVTEELSATYVPVVIAISFIKMLQTRNENRLKKAICNLCAMQQQMLEQSDRDRIQTSIKESSSRTPEELIAELNLVTSSSSSKSKMDEFRKRQADLQFCISHYEKVIEEYAECKRYYEYLFNQASQNHEPGVSSCFKRSTQKKDSLMMFLPTNTCCQMFRVEECVPKNSTQSSSESEQGRSSSSSSNTERVYLNITHGCAADHVSGFKDGGLRRLLAIPRKSQLLSKDEMVWQRIQRREDIVQCQVLGVAISTIASVIALAQLKSAPHVDQLEVASQVGFLLSVESLLSTLGNELGMLEDMDAGIKWLNNVKVHFVKNDSSDLTLCTGIVCGGADSNNAISVSMGLPRNQFEILPMRLREGYPLSISAVMFTQGINEMQSVANSVLDTRMQDVINTESLQVLQNYVEFYRNYLLTHKSLTPPPSSAFLQLEDLEKLQYVINGIGNNLLHSQIERMQKKNVNILIESSMLCRRLGAGRTTCCKSGKDRTAMSVTLEASRQFVQDFQVQHGVNLCNTMRCRGVRRTNVWINTGKRHFAFNGLQLKCLPDCYRPPPASTDAHVAS